MNAKELRVVDNFSRLIGGRVKVIRPIKNIRTGVKSFGVFLTDRDGSNVEGPLAIVLSAEDTAGLYEELDADEQ